MKKPPKPKDYTVVSFGKALRERRLALEMTQSDVAFKAGVSQTTIPAIEAGRKAGLRLETASILARAVGVSLKDLLPEN